MKVGDIYKRLDSDLYIILLAEIDHRHYRFNMKYLVPKENLTGYSVVSKKTLDELYTNIKPTSPMHKIIKLMFL